MNAIEKLREAVSSIQENVRAIMGGRFFSTSLKTQLSTLEVLRHLFQRLGKVESQLRTQEYANKKVTEALDVYLRTLQERMNHIIALDEKIFQQLLLQRSADKVSFPESSECYVTTQLIEFLFPWLKIRIAIDARAKQGESIQELLAMGFDQVFAFEPNPEWASLLKETYGMQKELQIFPYALSDKEGEADLCLVKSSQGSSVETERFSTLQPHPLPNGLEWDRKIPVKLCSLRSCIEAGTLPAHAGVLKIGTEGQDGWVLRGMPAECQYEIIIFKFWSKDHIYNAFEYSQQEDMIKTLRSMGYGFFISVVYFPDGKLQFVANTPIRVPHIYCGSTLCFREGALFEKAYTFMRAILPQTTAGCL